MFSGLISRWRTGCQDSGGGRSGSERLKETFMDEDFFVDMVFHKGEEVAAVAVVHPEFDLREGVVAVVEFRKVFSWILPRISRMMWTSAGILSMYSGTL